MKFITIAQYFYKLYNALLVILILPISVFIIVYLQPTDSLPFTPRIHPTFIQLSVIVAIDWLIMFFLFAKKIKSIRNQQGLGLKLEKYFSLTIVRYILIVLICFVLAFGFYISKDDKVTGLFVLNLLLLGILWPTSSRVCKDLKLRGDEREMVYYKKDNF